MKVWNLIRNFENRDKHMIKRCALPVISTKSQLKKQIHGAHDVERCNEFMQVTWIQMTIQ